MHDAKKPENLFHTTSSTSVPSSPPIIEHDYAVIRSPPQLQSPPPQQQSLSPELPHLHRPRTPASHQSRGNSSDYYTAIWGSPYDSPSILSRSARTAVSEQVLSDDFHELSSEPHFGLEHLLPNRLPALVFPPPPLLQQDEDADQEEPSSLAEQLTSQTINTRPDDTPRARTKQWVQLPQRESHEPEDPRWWSDEPALGYSDSEVARARSRTPAIVLDEETDDHPRRKHNSRAANRTLDQQSFWETIRGERRGDMSGLGSSRWAATPSPTPKPTVPAVKKDEVEEEKTVEIPAEEEKDAEEKNDSPVDAVQKEELTNGEPAVTSDTTPDEAPAEDAVEEAPVHVNGIKKQPADEVAADEEKPQIPPKDEVGGKEEDVEPLEKVRQVEDPTSTDWAEDAENAAASEAIRNKELPQIPQELISAPQPAPSPALPEPSPALGAQTMGIEPRNTPDPSQNDRPKLKKKFSLRGKAIIVYVPNIDFAAAGLPMPLSHAEIQARISKFEEDGYDTRGFDVAYNEEYSNVEVQARPSFPEEAPSQAVPWEQEEVKVTLPDLDRWKSYMDWLTEQKLAALGVSTGLEEILAPAQDMSRQSSTQYPPLPFSPPIPTLSAASIGRPGMIRGHSHTMSVASPISPITSPFGHMHRHSSLTGQLPQFSGLQGFNAQQPFNLAGLPRIGSPAQVSALRNELGGIRGPGSPLAQLPTTPQEYSRALVEDQRVRQHAHSQSMYAPHITNAFFPQSTPIRSVPALPELPEDDEEEEEDEELDEPEPVPFPQRSAYVPPHKREQDTEIVVPTPRHRHNISEGLERDVLEAEERLKQIGRDYIEVTEEYDDDEPSNSDSMPASLKEQFQFPAPAPPVQQHVEDDPIPDKVHSRKTSGTRLNVAAPVFTFNPTANFKPTNFTPTAPAFTFGASTTPTASAERPSHNRQTSSGSFNVAAPVFKPATSEFSFSAMGPSFKPAVTSFAPPKPAHGASPSIFGRVDLPEIIKPARRSKAIAIVRPEDHIASASGTEFEDETGRVTQGNVKRQRNLGDDGDEVPQFADPDFSAPVSLPLPPADKILGSTHEPHKLSIKEIEDGAQEAMDEIAYQAAEHHHQHSHAFSNHSQHGMPHFPPPAQHSTRNSLSKMSHAHTRSTSLSALATPFEPSSFLPKAVIDTKAQEHERYPSISELEEGELHEDDSFEASPAHGVNGIGEREVAPVVSPTQFKSRPITHHPTQSVINPEPTFDEIDAVMQQLNAEEEDPVSPLPPSPGSHPMQGVTYLADWTRSDAPSPSPQRKAHVDSSFTAQNRTDSGEERINGWPHVNRLNKAEDVATSEWSDILSPPDEERLHERSKFFDSHIDNIIGRAVEQRLQPLEESLRNIQSTVSKRARSSDVLLARTSSNVDSDADDEDDLPDDRKQRPISRGREKRLDQIKSAVLEALREQTPRETSVNGHASLDVSELHSVLADMKASFARAASTSLELDDIRVVVNDALFNHKHSVVPAEADTVAETHRQELSELERRLNETLANSLEEANHRRAIEEREAETRRMLRLAEEELNILRESFRDEESKTKAMEEDRTSLLARIESYNEARHEVQEKLEDAENQVETLTRSLALVEKKLEAADEDRASAEDKLEIGQEKFLSVKKQLEAVEDKNGALEETIAEYRVSHDKWRSDSEEAARKHEALEAQISALERQLEDGHETGRGMKRRLEGLHTSLSTAAAQLANEKSAWARQEQALRLRMEALEARDAARIKEHTVLGEELRVARAAAAEAVESQQALESIRASHLSLEDMVRKVQAESNEHQGHALRFERQFHDAQESGRAEVHRTRMLLETELEATKHQVNLVRSEYESELARTRTELDNLRQDAQTTRARHERLLEEEETGRREALRKVNHANSVALDEARSKYDAAVKDLSAQHTRALKHANEDKSRAETILNERLVLSDAKVQHFQERVAHLEERLEITRSAAQAAALNAQSRGVKSFAPRDTSSIPEKISPQALRESILVLQEQLQEREQRIEKLQTQVEVENAAKLKERDTEIAWLRELLAVRSEELGEVVNALSRPTFDREALRDTAIRIRANLEMEQQEKERFRPGNQTPLESLGSQALAGLSSLATPKAAAQLSSAFSKWRSSMESSALKSQARVGAAPASARRSLTPSKPAAPAIRAPSFSNGLMTPPASNLRSSPQQEDARSLPPPRLNSRTGSRSGPKPANMELAETPPLPITTADEELPTTPLFQKQDYDQDAENHEVVLPTMEDDDLEDVADSQPPAFRSLEDEMADSGSDEGEEEETAE